MREVCARTGLARSTIHHYIREGLLPKPEKTGRNTALYDEEFVQRARLVRALQENTHMPLATIRQTFDGMPDGAVGAIDPERFAGVANRIANELRLASERALTRAELLATTGLKPAELDGLSASRLVEPSPGGTYSPLDASIAIAISRIRGAGATIERGFAGSAEIVRAYRTHLTELARTEAGEMVRLMGSLADIDVEEFVKQILEPLGDLVAALHRKALVEAVNELNPGGVDGDPRR
jgi:DNA-binding transcriptional MerR regulator